ncbi:SDR family NAD(P)-dependent oxidoreductase [Bacteroidota bacterium]
MKKILITGGAGFIGSNLALRLIEMGHNVTILDPLNEQIHGQNPEETSPLYRSILGKVNFIKGSIINRLDIEMAIIEQDIIVHYAAETGTGQSMYEIDRYSAVNIGGTALLLDILTNKAHSVKKLVVASSRSIYGEGKYQSSRYGIVYPKHRLDLDMKDGRFEVSYLDDANLKLLPTDEESKIHPSSVYGITKQVQEQLVMTVCPAINIAPVALRYQNVYGPGQSLSNPYTGILSIFSNLILQGRKINIFEDGLESRDFVYISDVVDSTVLAIFNDKANGEVFNVGTGINISVKEVVEMLLSCFEKEVEFEITGNYRVGDIRHNFADLTKANKILGYSPKVDFKEGLTRFVSWVRNHAPNISDNSYEVSLSEMVSKGLFK